MPQFDHETQKQIVKEAISEWLDKKLSEFGWWTLKGVGAVSVAVLAYLFLSSHGWKP